MTRRNKMEFRSNIIIMCALALMSNLVFAGSVSDTYTAGDTLTAAKMESIKTAVNDNDARLSSGAASISYKSFTVEAQSQNQVTAVVPNGTTVTNTQAQCVYLKSNGTSYGYFLNVATATNASCDLNAGVQVPHGVTLTGFSCTVFDNDTTSGSNINFNLSRVNMVSGIRNTVYSSVTSSVDSTLVQVLSDTNGPDTANANIIDNSLYTYSIDINFGSSSFAAVGNLVRLYGCRMTY